MILTLSVSNENGHIKTETMDLAKAFANRGISNTSGHFYIADMTTNFSQFYAASGGQIFPSQRVNTQQGLMETETSLNIQIRYDITDPLDKRWNIDVEVHVHGKGLTGYDKIIIDRHPKKIHKIPDASFICVDVSINGKYQYTVKMNRP